MSERTRILDDKLKKHFDKYEQILILLGARQTGKTTLVNRIFTNSQYLLVDNEAIRSVLETYDISAYKQLAAKDSRVLVIDEIQRLSDPGRAAKILYDQIPGLRIVITGSSSLSIKNKTTESLAGRKISYELFPLSFSEYLFQEGIEDRINFEIFERATNGVFESRIHLFDLKSTLETVLLYGLYPQMIQKPRDKVYLSNLAETVIFKDIIDMNLIDNRADALNVLKLLAYQIGNLVNYTEVSSKLGIDARTVRRYIDIFEQSYIIFRIFPFSTKARDEIGKSPKIYFYDTGLRNALINNFEGLRARADAGFLFENFIISEIFKANSYKDKLYEINYWRTTKGAEVDLVLRKAEKNPIGVEIKFSGGKVSRAFTTRYPKARTAVVTADNFY